MLSEGEAKRGRCSLKEILEESDAQISRNLKWASLIEREAQKGLMLSEEKAKIRR